VPSKLLDPTLDITFKLLLLRNPVLLRDMIESVVKLPAPIAELIILNPEIPKEFPADKSIALDIRVRLHNGHQIDLEMQSTIPPGTRGRFLYYWARGFTDLLAAGDDYTLLKSCISVLWFKEPLLRGTQFHSIFHLSEDTSREVFSDLIEFHVLELPKLHLATADRQARLEKWARFLRARTTEELEAVANEDPIMTAAKHTLEELSDDPNAQRLARDREISVLMHRHLLAASAEEGEARGEARGLLIAIRSLCSVLGIALDPAKVERLSTLDTEQLSALVHALEVERRWPEGF
jgi:predicted transposase/invertase (TIGR01784 family)